MRGEAVARTGPSPGLRNVQWPHPVYAGDLISYAHEIVGRATRRTARTGSGSGWRAIPAPTSRRRARRIRFETSTFIRRCNKLA